MNKIISAKSTMLVLGAMLVSTLITPQAMASNGKAMTWKAYDLPPNAGVRVGCFDVCDAYVGDTDIATKLPILCFVPGNAPIPSAYQAYAVAQRPNDWQFYMNWSGGQVGLTNPVLGQGLTLAAANTLCQKTLKDPNARMAEHHDNGAGGWSLGASVHIKSKTPNALKHAGPKKFWTSINDQNANPW
jgi:hypothetical protein